MDMRYLLKKLILIKSDMILTPMEKQITCTKPKITTENFSKNFEPSKLGLMHIDILRYI
jgi:hypothetical protein